MSSKVELYPFAHPKNKETGWLSQWYPCEFVEGDEKFTSTEQYMMLKKALLFNDLDAAAKIRATQDPKTILHLGRQVKHFNQENWDAQKEKIVEEGNYLKFSQNAELKAKLLATGSKILVETFAHDLIWSCGLSYRDPNVLLPDRWPGQNLLGKALMAVRSRLT